MIFQVAIAANKSEMNTKRLIPYLIILAIFLSPGCGGNVRLGGHVRFSDDNSPLSTGTVFFETDTYLARGELRPDGSFDVGSLSPRDGITPGKYRVYIIGATKDIGDDKAGLPILEPLIDEKFTSAQTSGLEIEIDKSRRNFDIVVDRYVPSKKI